MNANRFFSVPYDNRNDITIKLLRHNANGLLGYGRWVALLGMLYDAHGCMRLEVPGMAELVVSELDFCNSAEMREYMETLSELGLIDSTAWSARNAIVNKGVCNELEYRRGRSENGKKGGRPKKESEA